MGHSFLSARIGATLEAACFPRAHNPLNGQPMKTTPAEMVERVAYAGGAAIENAPWRLKKLPPWSEQMTEWIADLDTGAVAQARYGGKP